MGPEGTARAGGWTKPVGVVLCTYGEPHRNSLMEHGRYSWHILQRLTRKVAKIPAVLLPLITLLRAWRRLRLWDQHHFISPLEPLTEQTVQAVQAQLDREKPENTGRFLVTHAYEFRRPRLTEALGQLRERGCERFILVPMYVGAGDFTVGMTRLAAQDALDKLPWLKPEHLAWALLSSTAEARERLAEVLAEHVLTSVRARGITLPAKDWALLLAAHGTLHTAPANLDNGLKCAGDIGRRVARRLRSQFRTVRFGWLNHRRGGRWTEPALPRALARLQKEGDQNLVYFPWGFTTDNAETALEGRVQYQALPQPFRQVEHLSCLNHEPGFIRFLAERIALTNESGSGDG